MFQMFGGCVPRLETDCTWNFFETDFYRLGYFPRVVHGRLRFKGFKSRGRESFIIKESRMEFLFIRLLLRFSFFFLVFYLWNVSDKFEILLFFSLLLLLIFWQDLLGLVEYRKIRECERREEWEGIEFIIRAECLARVGLDNDRGVAIGCSNKFCSILFHHFLFHLILQL